MRPAPPTPSARRTRWAIGLVLVVAVAWNLIGNLLLPGGWYVPANLAVATVVVAMARRDGRSWSDLGLDRADVGRGVRYGVVAMAVIAGVMAVGLLLPPVRALLEDEAVAADSTFENWFVPLVRIPLGTAVFEELLFRSALLALLTRLRGVVVGVVASSGLFGLWHIVPAAETAPGGAWSVAASIVGTVVITSLAGVAFALLRVRSGSVVAPILAHTATNSFAYAAALVALGSGD